MTKHLLAGAKNTLSQYHTGEKCHAGKNYKIKQDISHGWTNCQSGYKVHFQVNGVDVMSCATIHPNMLRVDEKSTGRCEWVKT